MYIRTQRTLDVGVSALNDNYIECDINYQGMSRGAERIVFNINYNKIYYTSDHYGSFVRVYDNYNYDNKTMFN